MDLGARRRSHMPDLKMYFKDEGGPERDPFGPVQIVDADALAAWKVKQGLGPDSWGVPYGSTPDGIEDLGWQSRSWARAEAERRGIALEES